MKKYLCPALILAAITICFTLQFLESKNLLQRINQLESTNKSLNQRIDKLKIEYEYLGTIVEVNPIPFSKEEIEENRKKTEESRKEIEEAMQHAIEEAFKNKEESK